MRHGVSDKQVGGKRRPKWRLHPHHLANWRNVGALYLEAKATGIVGQAKDDAIYFFTAAVHAIRVAVSNPCGLFNNMIRQREQRWMFLTNHDVQRGAEWWKAWSDQCAY